MSAPERRTNGFGAYAGRSGSLMIFTIRDIELLCLLRWCRYLPPDELADCFDEMTIANLKGLRLILAHKASGALTMTSEGDTFLEAYIKSLPENVRQSYLAANTLRRIRRASVMLTAYRAGLRVFTTDIMSLKERSAFYLPTLMRGHGTNPWSNSRIAALLRLGDMLFAAHYVCPGIGEMLLVDELNAFHNNTAQIKNVARAFFFAGASYGDILAELDVEPATELKRYVSYADAYRQLSLPVHLLSCDATGAMQLRLMALPDYRQTLTRAALQARYAPAPKDVPAWDALFEGKPFVMAADMDLRRIDDAIHAARERGMNQIVMAALKPQVEAVLKKRYRDTGLARVYSIKEDALRELGVSTLYTPPMEGYRTDKGEVIHAPLIQAARKTGRPSGKQSRTLV